MKALRLLEWKSEPEIVEDVESTTYSLDDAVQAYRDLQAGEVRGRAVVVP